MYSTASSRTRLTCIFHESDNVLDCETAQADRQLRIYVTAVNSLSCKFDVSLMSYVVVESLKCADNLSASAHQHPYLCTDGLVDELER